MPSSFDRDAVGGIIFLRSKETPLTAVDALTIGEAHAPTGGVPGLNTPRTIILKNGRENIAKYVITTPNSHWLPDISDTKPEVRTRIDGRYGDHDFTQWPQWYFDETRHLAFVPSKPGNLSNHPYSVLWHDMTTSDFDYERGAVFTDLRKISEKLLEKVMDIWHLLTKDFSNVTGSSDVVLTPIERHILETSIRNMQLSSVCLNVAPQTFFATLCTFTLFQRYALEGLGCHDFVTKWSNVKAMANDRFIPPLNATTPVVGAITSRVEVAVELASLGAPVWLVRPPHLVNPSTVKIVNTTDPTSLSQAGLVAKRTDDRQSVKFSSRPSPARNRACVCLRLGHLQLGAYSGLRSAHPLLNLPMSPPPPIPHNAMVPVHVNLPTFGQIPNAKRFNVNTDKFKEPEPEFWPYVVRTWRQALENCPRDWSQVYQHDDASLIRGYALMDPYFLAKKSPSGDIALAGWLFIRTPWISQIATRWHQEKPGTLIAWN